MVKVHLADQQFPFRGFSTNYVGQEEAGWHTVVLLQVEESFAGGEVAPSGAGLRRGWTGVPVQRFRPGGGGMEEAGRAEKRPILEHPAQIRQTPEGGSRFLPQDPGEEFHLGFNGRKPAVDRHADLPALKSHPPQRFLVELLLNLPERKVAEDGSGYHDAKGKQEKEPAPEGGAEMGKYRRHED